MPGYFDSKLHGVQRLPGQSTSQDPALEPTCQFTLDAMTEIARPGIRLLDFTQRLSGHGTFSTICTADYSSTLTAIAGAL